jgi:hypothetical protein
MKSTLALAAAAACIGTSAYAAVGDQIIVKDLIAARGWTAVVPLNLGSPALSLHNR